MVRVLADNGNFTVEGEFDFGYMGHYKDGQIEIQEDADEVRCWDIVAEALDAESCSDDELAQFLTGYINELEQRVQKNIKQINDNFLLMVFWDMQSCGSQFWEIEELTDADALPDDPDDTVYELGGELYELVREYSNSPNDGSVVKQDVEAALRRLFPMFKFDVFLKGIVPEWLSFFDRYVSFQCSDKFGCAILCGAYDELDEQFRFTDWHNF